MSKVFISVPMRGRKVKEIRDDMSKIFAAYCDPEKDELLDTTIREESPKSKRLGVWYLGRSIQMLADADLVIFGPGYSKAPGCMTEGLVALLYGIPHTFIGRTKMEQVDKEDKEDNNNED